MHYVLHDKKVWIVPKKTINFATIRRGDESQSLHISNLMFIYPEFEAVKLLNEYKINSSINFRKSIKLPFVKDHYEQDNELTLFLKEVIKQTDDMVKSPLLRQESKSMSLEFYGCKLEDIIHAFNEKFPEANKIEVTWEDNKTTTYLCTKSTCNLDNLIIIPPNYQADISNAMPTFLDTSVKDGATLLWARVVLANYDLLKIDSFNDVRDGCQYLPFNDDGRIYGQTKIKRDYLDWLIEVIDTFNDYVVQGKLSRLRSQGIYNGPYYDAINRDKKKFEVSNYWPNNSRA